MSRYLASLVSRVVVILVLGELLFAHVSILPSALFLHAASFRDQTDVAHNMKTALDLARICAKMSMRLKAHEDLTSAKTTEQRCRLNDRSSQADMVRCCLFISAASDCHFSKAMERRRLSLRWIAPPNGSFSAFMHSASYCPFSKAAESFLISMR